MTREDIAGHRLLSQQLLGGKTRTPQDVVRWLGAVQAQDFSGAKWALGMRLGDSVNDADVERAFTKGSVLRTHLLRPTWHFVTPADIRWLLALTAPRVQAANKYIYRKLGLDVTTLRRCNAVLTKVLQGGQQRTRDELRDILQQSGVRTDGELCMSYLLMNAELEGVVCSGPRRGKQFTYALLDEKVPNSTTLDRKDALVELAQRYFVSRGPATVHDFAKWSGLTVSDARSGLEGVQHSLRHEVVNGRTLWFSPRKRGSSRRALPTVHLLSVYDEYLSGYKDRSAIISASSATRLSAMGNALSYLVVVRGQIVGTWNRRVEKNVVHIKMDLFERITKTEQRAISTAIQKYANFIGLTVNRS